MKDAKDKNKRYSLFSSPPLEIASLNEFFNWDFYLQQLTL